MTTYPKWVYHKEHAPEGLCVHSEEDEPVGDGWVSTPAKFDPNYVDPPPLTEDAQFDLLAREGRPFVAYPSWRYHKNGEARLVETAEADEQLDKSVWKDTPLAFTNLAVPVPTPITPHDATPPPGATSPPTRPADRKVKDKE
jgi:hypothetical protein